MKLALRYWLSIGVVALIVAGLLSVNYSAGAAAFWGAAMAALGVVVAMDARQPARYTAPLIIVGLLGVAQITVVTYLHAAGVYLSIDRHVPFWLTALGAAIACAGIALAGLLAWVWLCATVAHPDELKVPFAVYAAATALMPISLIYTLPELRQSGEADFFSRPITGLGLVVLGLLLCWVSLAAFTNNSLAIMLQTSRNRPRLWAIAVAAILLPAVFYATAPSFFLQGGGQFAFRYVSYKALLEPDPSNRDRFRLTQTSEAIVNKVTRPPKTRIDFVSAVPAGFLFKQVNFMPLTGDYSGVKNAVINVNGLAPDQIIVPHLRSDLGDKDTLTTVSYPDEENAQWTLKSLDAGVSFYIGPPLPGPLSQLLKPFMGLASIGAWLLLVLSLVLIAGVRIVGELLTDKVKDWLKARFSGGKRSAPPASVDRPSSS